MASMADPLRLPFSSEPFFPKRQAQERIQILGVPFTPILCTLCSSEINIEMYGKV